MESGRLISISFAVNPDTRAGGLVGPGTARACSRLVPSAHHGFPGLPPGLASAPLTPLAPLGSPGARGAGVGSTLSPSKDTETARAAPVVLEGWPLQGRETGGLQPSRHGQRPRPGSGAIPQVSQDKSTRWQLGLGEVYSVEQDFHPAEGHMGGDCGHGWGAGPGGRQGLPHRMTGERVPSLGRHLLCAP